MAALARVRADIAEACRDAHRDPAAVHLVAISKTFDADAIRPVIDAQIAAGVLRPVARLTPLVTFKA